MVLPKLQSKTKLGCGVPKERRPVNDVTRDEAQLYYLAKNKAKLCSCQNCTLTQSWGEVFLKKEGRSEMLLERRPRYIILPKTRPSYGAAKINL